MRTIITTIIISAALVTITSGQDYFPLKEGNQWIYSLSNGVQMTMQVTGFADIDGVPCAIVESTVETETQVDVSREYLAVATDGLRAYMAEAQGQALLYDPPIQRIKLPFEPGQSWTATMNLSDMPRTTTFESVRTEQITTPAGDFDCIVVSSIANFQPPMMSETYYADGAGMVLQKMRVSGRDITSTLISMKVQPTEQILAPPKEVSQEIQQDSEVQEISFEKCQSQDGTLRLYKPYDWTIVEEEIEQGARAIYIVEPYENAAVVFMTFSENEEITDSVTLSNKCIERIKNDHSDLKIIETNSTSEKDRTIVNFNVTGEDYKGIGHGYFFYTQRVGTAFVLLCLEDMREQMLPVLTYIAANIAYTPDGIVTVIEQGGELAARTVIAQGKVTNPAAMIQQAEQQTGIQVPLVETALSDNSITLQIPQNWNLEGQQLQFLALNDTQTKTHGMISMHQTVLQSTKLSVNSLYKPPPQALGMILELNQIGTNILVRSQFQFEQAFMETSKEAKELYIQGFNVDTRLIYVQFNNIATDTVSLGLFCVTCTSIPLTNIWYVTVNGYWAPDSEFDQWLPLYVRINRDIEVNQEWIQANQQNRYNIQQQLNMNLQNSIVGSDQTFEQDIDSNLSTNSNRDYSSWMWTQTTLGQGIQVAKREGASVYQAQFWGIDNPQIRIDSPSYNTIILNSENP